MRRKLSGSRGEKLAAAGTAVAAFALVLAVESPAHAVVWDDYIDCSTPGVSGHAYFRNESAYHVDMRLTVKDEVADGHHVAIRFVSQNSTTLKYRYWTWHNVYSGKGSTKTWTTYANDSSGHINIDGIWVAVMEGSEQIGNCWNMV